MDLGETLIERKQNEKSQLLLNISGCKIDEFVKGIFLLFTKPSKLTSKNSFPPKNRETDLIKNVTLLVDRILVTKKAR